MVRGWAGGELDIVNFTMQAYEVWYATGTRKCIQEQQQLVFWHPATSCNRLLEVTQPPFTMLVVGTH